MMGRVIPVRFVLNSMHIFIFYLTPVCQRSACSSWSSFVGNLFGNPFKEVGEEGGASLGLGGDLLADKG